MIVIYISLVTSYTQHLSSAFGSLADLWSNISLAYLPNLNWVAFLFSICKFFLYPGHKTFYKTNNLPICSCHLWVIFPFS